MSWKMRNASLFALLLALFAGSGCGEDDDPTSHSGNPDSGREDSGDKGKGGSSAENEGGGSATEGGRSGSGGEETADASADGSRTPASKLAKPGLPRPPTDGLPPELEPPR